MRPRKSDQDSRKTLTQKVAAAKEALVDPASLAGNVEAVEILAGLCERYLARSIEERRLVKRIKKGKDRLPWLNPAAKDALDLALLGLEDATPNERQSLRSLLLQVLANKPEKPRREASSTALNVGGRILERPRPVAVPDP